MEHRHSGGTAVYEAPETAARQKNAVPDYSESPCTLADHLLAFLLGAAIGFAVLYVFYKIIPLCILGGVIVGVVNIFLSEQSAVNKRLSKLRVQFFDMLEAMSVAMRAGNPIHVALESAKNDLAMIYPQNSDIMLEMDILLRKFNNSIPLSQALADFAERSGLEDIDSFASIYKTIEGKSSRADEIVRETQQIISDKMEIEMEIETMMTAAKSEVNIMLFMPLVILGVIGQAGAGFMDTIYTTAFGRIVATVGLIVFIICFFLARKFSKIEV